MNAIKARTDRPYLTPLFLLLGVLCSPVVVMPLPTLSQTATTISVNPTVRRGKVNPLVFGANHRYGYSGFSMWDKTTNNAYPAFSTAFRKAGITSVRFPGGTIAGKYHWQRAIGPVAQRTRNIHGSTKDDSSLPVTNEFGPDEFGRFIKQNGATGSIVVNIGTGSAQEAADWVEYMNAPVGTNPGGGIAWAEVRQSNGGTDPYNITYWEVGNENNNKDQVYWMGTVDKQKYAFGGTTTFTKERVGKFDDHRDSAAVSNGEVAQVFYVKYPSVQPNQTVYVDDQAWIAVANLSEAGAINAYELDHQTGKIQFGDGINGNIPPTGSVVTIDYISGPHDGFVDFYKAMKAVDSNIKVCTSYDVSDQLKAAYPFDCVVSHPYTFTSFSTGSTADNFHDNVMLQPERRAAQVKALRQTLRTNVGAGADNIEIVISEYGIDDIRPDSQPRPLSIRLYQKTLGGALYYAESLKHWLQLGIPLAQKHSLIDFAFSDPPAGLTYRQYTAIFGEAPAFVSSATALVFNLYKDILGSELIQSSMTNNPVRILPNGKSLSALQTVTSIDPSGSLNLFVINRDRTTNVTANVSMQSYRSTGIANVKTLNGSSYLSYNTPTNPNIVKIRQQTISIAPNQFTYTFPAHSVTAIKISGAVELL
jgi:alpha-N-arabinofuranosidase